MSCIWNYRVLFEITYNGVVKYCLLCLYALSIPIFMKRYRENIETYVFVVSFLNVLWVVYIDFMFKRYFSFIYGLYVLSIQAKYFENNRRLLYPTCYTCLLGTFILNGNSVYDEESIKYLHIFVLLLAYMSYIFCNKHWGLARILSLQIVLIVCFTSPHIVWTNDF